MRASKEIFSPRFRRPWMESSWTVRTRDEDCVITFQTESVVEKFLLKFERLQMDCNDHLYIYDGAHVAGAWRVS